MNEIILPESAKPVPPPDLDYHIRRLRRRAAHERNEVGDILLPSDVIMDDAADALEWAKAKLEAMGRPTVETMLRALAEIGIYPKTVIGEYEQRTDFMDGWNAVLIEIGKQLAVLPAAQEEQVGL